MTVMYKIYKKNQKMTRIIQKQIQNSFEISKSVIFKTFNFKTLFLVAALGIAI